MAIKIQDQRTDEAKEKGRAKKLANQVSGVLDDLETNWDTLTQAQKLNALKNGLIIALKVARFLVKRA